MPSTRYIARPRVVGLRRHMSKSGYPPRLNQFRECTEHLRESAVTSGSRFLRAATARRSAR